MHAQVDIHQLTRGRWPDILVRFGIDRDCLNKNHTSCPVCGGKDRFRFDDRTGNGDWVCSGHGFRRSQSVGAGNGIDLLMGYLDKPFKEVAKELRATILGGEVPEPKQVVIVKPEPDRQEVLAKFNRLAAKSQPVTKNNPVDRYLLGRGLSGCSSNALRYVPRLWYTHQGELLGSFPGMIAPVVSVDGEILAYHRTWLAPKGEGKAPVPEAKKMSNKGAMGGAIRLFDPVDGFIAITEGIETALAVHELYGWPVWATIATAFMEGVRLPKEIDKVVICADHDPIDPKRGTRPGHVAAIALAKRLRDEGRTVKIILPQEEGTDFLDVLNARKQQVQS
ncbi:DUF7146 domain-containing protein [Gulbenkiania mobilis]|uniref:DUF7146 domain-containing protein n=1 Tax=Gulbenkiania mobilis TaxID=397457 RepID=UPI0006BBBF46|nr:toprim domain-containing protein [Gulbenkiania mobilis]